jgi:hypothetical protein
VGARCAEAAAADVFLPTPGKERPEKWDALEARLAPRSTCGCTGTEGCGRCSQGKASTSPPGAENVPDAGEAASKKGRRGKRKAASPATPVLAER